MVGDGKQVVVVVSVELADVPAWAVDAVVGRDWTAVPYSRLSNAQAPTVVALLANAVAEQRVRDGSAEPARQTT